VPLLKTKSGEISYQVKAGALTRLTWGNEYAKNCEDVNVSLELKNYFAGTLKKFNSKVEPEGTIFQKKVWQALLDIPYGTLVTYKDIAKKVNSHPRAVGGAVGKNPIPIIIPCHRVVGSNGALTGFSGGNGLPTKEILIQHEQQNINKEK